MPLKGAGFQGVLSLEPHRGGWPGPVQGRRQPGTCPVLSQTQRPRSRGLPPVWTLERKRGKRGVGVSWE